MELTGLSFLGKRRGSRGGAVFQAFNPRTGGALPPAYHSASPAEVDEAARLAAEAFESYSQLAGKARAAFLRRAADGFDHHKQELAERAHLETALPMARLLGEVGRTSNQLRMFAGIVEEGSWCRRASTRRCPTASRFPAPIFAPCCARSGPWSSSAPAIFRSRFPWGAVIRLRPSRRGARSSSKPTQRILEPASWPPRSSRALSRPRAFIPACSAPCTDRAARSARRWSSIRWCAPWHSRAH